MTSEEICALALAADGDLESRIVFDDALEEAVWSPPVIEGLNTFRYELHDYLYDPAMRWDSGGAWDPQAVAAVLLFEGWPRTWELAGRCTIPEPRLTVRDLRVPHELPRGFLAALAEAMNEHGAYLEHVEVPGAMALAIRGAAATRLRVLGRYYGSDATADSARSAISAWLMRRVPMGMHVEVSLDPFDVAMALVTFELQLDVPAQMLRARPSDEASRAWLDRNPRATR